MRPLIFDFCENRIGDEKVPYFYDEKQDINVIKLDNGNLIPFIDFNLLDTELKTITKAIGEQSDEGIELLEMMTKTATQREQDDIEPSLELITKT